MTSPFISVAANPKLPFNGERDLVPVAAVAATPHILIVGANSPVKSVQELIALAKARADTPRASIDKISADVAHILETPEMKERMAGAGVQILSLTADRFGDYSRDDIARWRGIVRQAGISLD